jgi:hypothetical protein
MTSSGLAKALLVGLLLTTPADPDEPPYRSPGTVRTAERMEWIARTTDPLENYSVGSSERLRHYRRKIDEATTLTERTQLQLQTAWEFLYMGRTPEAIEGFLGVRRVFQRPDIRPTDSTVRKLDEAFATAYLRLGEETNCLARHGPESCLMPIRGTGIHTLPQGSRKAIEELASLLRRYPDDVASRWLLNLAYMTLGEYPDGVPSEWRIPPSTFASDHDVKTFPNIASKLGLDVVGTAGGSIMEDFDRDGFLDIMASGWGLREQLRYFRNNGDGTFSERTEQAGLLGQVSGLNMCHTDYDNDGDADVLVLRGAWLHAEGLHPNSLLRNNGDGTFDDVSDEAGLTSLFPTQTAAWADYDNDGWLDLFVGNESSQRRTYPSELYRNNGDGTFTEVAAELGVANVGFVKGVAWGDYDNDGLQDLYLSRLDQPNVLYRNEGSRDGKWRFTEVTEKAGVAEPLSSFPTWFWDYDNDGWLDLYVAPFPGFNGDSLASIAAGYLGRRDPQLVGRLYRNNGDGTFSDTTSAVGWDLPMLVMGANFGDLDNDGYPDVYLGTGEPNLHTLLPNRMYRNAEGRRFQNVTTSGGFGHLQKGHGISFGDIDNDGDQDIYAVMGGQVPGDVAYNALFLNPGHGNRWITLQLEGVRSNRAAIGARIRVAVETAAGTREIHAMVGTGGSFGSNSLQQEIGLGAAISIREVEIRWPATNQTQLYRNLEPDRAYRIREGEAQAEPLGLKRIELANPS